MEKRRKMLLGDWLNGAALCVVGVYFGLVVHGMSQLIGTAFFWPMLIFIMIIWGGLYVFDNAVEGLSNWMFPSGIKPAKNSKVNERKPLARLLSLPCGIVLGVILAEIGLSDTLLFFT